MMIDLSHIKIKIDFKNKQRLGKQLEEEKKKVHRVKKVVITNLYSEILQYLIIL